MAKTAVVTGASSGIGRATVQELTAQGWTVIAAARRVDKLSDLAAQTGCISVQCDVTKEADVAALAAAVQAHGKLNALVNNAGLAIGTDAVEDADLSGWQTMYETNVLGTVRVTKALLPLLRETAKVEPNVDILTVTSTAGHTAYEGGGGYTASKHGTTDVVETLRLELAGEPIRVTEIAPGMVHTPEFSLKRLGDADKAAKVYDGVQDPLTAEDIGHVIVTMLELPTQINLDLVVVRPVAQAAQHKVFRGKLTPKEA